MMQSERNEVDFSPVNQKAVEEVDLRTPCDASYSKDHFPEITPDGDLQKVETTLCLPRLNKMLVADKNKSMKEKGQKTSKRKLFSGQSVSASGNESDFGIAEKRKKTEENVKRSSSIARNTGYCPVKLPLTERQQLALLLEVTSAQTCPDRFEDQSGKDESGFTKIRPRKGKKDKASVVNSRVYRRNERGETPLHIAAMKGDVTGIKKLIKEGAEVGVKDYAGWTALHEACNHGNLAAAKILLAHGAVVNVPGFEGDTPLHDAVINNHVEIADMLLSSGANPRQANTKGKNPTDCVYSKEMSEVFSSHGVQLPATRKVDSEFSSSCNIDRNCDGKTIPESTKSKNVKGQSEQCNKGSILRNEIQRKQTQGESKMEKPVMYICKLTSGEYDQEITVRTTQAIQPLQEEPGGDELEFELGTETEVHAGLSGDESFTLERREKAGELPKCRSGKVTGNILTSSEEVRSEKERPAKTGVVSQLAENVSSSVLDQQGKRPLQKESITNEQNEYGEVLSRKHSSGPAQAIAQMSFKARLLRHQEAETPALKESQDKGKVKDINPLEKDEREILVNSEQSDMNTKENQNPEEDVEGQISRSSHSSLENSHLSFQTVPLHVIISPDINGAANENKVCRKTEITYAVRDERELLITPKQDDQDTKGFGSKVSCVENKTEQITDISHEAASQEQIMPNDSPNQIESHQIDEMDKAVHVRDQSQEERHPVIENCKGSERIPSGCSPMVSKPRRPPITWRSLLAGNGCKLSELRIPYYDQFLINTKDYELSNGVVNSERLQKTTRTVPVGCDKEKEELFLNQKRAKEELRQKQKSEKAKLQICMEQEIVRFHAMSAYSSFNNGPPPGVCAALCWQNMSQQQLKVEKQKLSQRRFLKSTKVSQSSYQAIIDKYDKLKKLMGVRHRHEQQALDALSNEQMQSV